APPFSNLQPPSALTRTPTGQGFVEDVEHSLTILFVHTGEVVIPYRTACCDHHEPSLTTSRPSQCSAACFRFCANSAGHRSQSRERGLKARVSGRNTVFRTMALVAGALFALTTCKDVVHAQCGPYEYECFQALRYGKAHAQPKFDPQHFVPAAVRFRTNIRLSCFFAGEYA